MARPVKNVTTELALLAKDLIASGQTEADIGVITGVLGKDSKTWLADLKKECTSVDEFIELARKRADIALVAAAIEAAMGYDYEEVDQEYLSVPAGKDVNGKTIKKVVEGNRKVKKRHARKNESLLKFILKNRLPEYFQDVSKVEVNKKSIEIKEITAHEIEQFAGKLLETVKNESV